MTAKFMRTGLPSNKELLDEARFLWRYDAESGGFVWIDRRTHRQPRPGKRVGGADGRGYLMCLLLGHKFKVHQIVWLWHKGELPTMMIDHINGRRDDNRIENLRLCTPSQNVHNQKRLLDESRGYQKCRKTGKYRPKVIVNGKAVFAGGYESRAEAHKVYIQTKQQLLGEFSPE